MGALEVVIVDELHKHSVEVPLIDDDVATKSEERKNTADEYREK
jgi:hypothetical protein